MPITNVDYEKAFAMTTLSRRKFCGLMAGGLAMTALRSEGADKGASLPRPNEQQLAWQDCELGMFYHFDIPVYKQGWNWRSWKDLPDPSLYNPTEA